MHEACLRVSGAWLGILSLESETTLRISVPSESARRLCKNLKRLGQPEIAYR